VTTFFLCNPRLNRRILVKSIRGMEFFSFFEALVCFPFLQIYDGEGQSLTTWKAWQVFAYFYLWWNYS